MGITCVDVYLHIYMTIRDDVSSHRVHIFVQNQLLATGTKEIAISATDSKDTLLV